MRSLILLALLLVPIQAYGWGVVHYQEVVGEAEPAFCEGFTGLVCEDFEGTGTPTDWTTVASPDFDYTTAPAPLAGAGSLALSYVDQARSHSFLLTTTLYFGFRLHTRSLDNPGDMEFIQLYSDTTLVGYIIIRAADTPRFFHGGTNASGAAINATTEYYMWGTYDTSGNFTLRVGTTGVYDDSTLSINGSGGTSTLGVTQIRLIHANSEMTEDIIFDNLKVQSTAIGDM